MPASMNSVTTRGFGNGTFAGTASLVVTLGYGIASAAPPPILEFAIDFLFTRNHAIDFLFTRNHAVDFLFTRNHAINFEFTQNHAVDFRYTRNHAIDFGEAHG